MKSDVGSWSGSVYVAEYQPQTGGRVGSYIIVPDGGTPTNGGYSGNVSKAPNWSLPPATFLNQTFAGDPVNVANGNMFRDEVDFTFANPIIPLDFARHYDSQNKLDAGFGVGWVHSFTGFVYEDQDPANANDKDYIWLRGNGERHVFEDLNFTLPNTLFGDIVTTTISSNNRRLTAFKDRSGTQYEFEPLTTPFLDATTQKMVYGRLVAIKDATGSQGVTITYESATSTRVKEVHSISSPNQYLRFVYTATTSGVERYEAGALVGSWGYVLGTNAAYSGKRLTQAKHANSNTIVTNYAYYDDGPATRLGLIKQITEPNGEFHAYEYYANGRVFRVTHRAGNQQSYNYNLFRNLTEFTDENGNVETYIHQDNGLLTKQIHNDRSRLEFTWGPQTGNGPVQWEEFLMKSSTDERGGRESFEYYSFSPSNPSQRPGELYTSTSKDGIVTRYDYENHAYISAVKTITVTPTGGSSTVTAQYTHDPANGHVLSAIDAEGHKTIYEYYDSSAPTYLQGLRKSETQPKGVYGQPLASSEVYEAVPWETLTDSFTISGDTIAVQLLTAVAGQYATADAIRIDRVDEDGIFARIVDSTSNSGDPNFRLGTGVIAITSSSSNTYGSGSMFGGQNLRIDGTSAQQVGATWIFRDLKKGKYRISASWNGPSGNTSAAKYQIYDGLPDGMHNQLVTGIDQTATPDDFRSYQTVFEYDTAGNVTRSITEGLPSGRRAYDSFGNVIYEEDATGTATVYEYDALGRLTKSYVTKPTSIDFNERTPVSYAGDGGQDLTGGAAIQDDGQTLYMFGNSWKAVPLGYDVTANTVLELDFKATAEGESHMVAFAHGYSAAHGVVKGLQLFGTQSPSAATVLASPQYTFGAETMHYRIPIGQYLTSGAYEYLVFGNDDDGNTPANGAGQGVSYFSNLRVYEASSIDRMTYGYDKSGRLVSAIDALNRPTNYFYDAAGRLARTTYADRTFTTHQYDAIGNCIATTDELGRTTRYIYDDRNRLVQTIFADGTSTRVRYNGTGQAVINIDERGNRTLFSYDKAGRLLTTTVAYGTADQTSSVNKYDLRGRLAESVDGNGIVTKYQYDNADQLIQTTVLDRSHVSPGDSAMTPIQTSKMPIQVTTINYDSNGNIARTAVFDPRKFASSDYPMLLSEAALLINSQNETDNKVHVARTTHDAFGRPVEVTNADGTSTSTIYDAAGRVRFTFDELGRKTEQEYDDYGRLLRVTPPDPDGPGSEESPQLEYYYNAAGSLIEEKQFFGDFDGLTDVWYSNLYDYDRRRPADHLQTQGFGTRSKRLRRRRPIGKHHRRRRQCRLHPLRRTWPRDRPAHGRPRRLGTAVRSGHK